MDEIADPAALKALANPLRQRILRCLERGEATSTSLAKELGVTTGGTSYNLRVLADNGFVEEVPGRTSGRERWWRATNRELRFPRHSEQDTETREALDWLNRLWSAEYAEAHERFERARDRLGPWRDAEPYSRGTIKVTLAQLERFFLEYLDLLHKYAAPEEGEGDAREVMTYFVAFPDVPEDA
ncbi:ArsR/SmtB family transcription factor [Spongiactinospora rosea]|uniref:ArsR/SmtB family transcription factor n=1 Tax=Spongiactinospora rosea TaxID=2248750 RepID=UPI0018F4D1EF|nr:helix-turn-helix domain-containing protein [Spongiactinospora rosea]